MGRDSLNLLPSRYGERISTAFAGGTLLPVGRVFRHRVQCPPGPLGHLVVGHVERPAGPTIVRQALRACKPLGVSRMILQRSACNLGALCLQRCAWRSSRSESPCTTFTALSLIEPPPLFVICRVDVNYSCGRPAYATSACRISSFIAERHAGISRRDLFAFVLALNAPWVVLPVLGVHVSIRLFVDGDCSAFGHWP